MKKRRGGLIVRDVSRPRARPYSYSARLGIAVVRKLEYCATVADHCRPVVGKAASVSVVEQTVRGSAVWPTVVRDSVACTGQQG